MIQSNSTFSRLRKNGLSRTMATAAVAASSALATANASVIYSGVLNSSITLNNSGPVNVDHIGSVEFTMQNTNSGNGAELYLSPLSSDFKFIAPFSSSDYPNRLAFGVSVGATNTFSPAMSNINSLANIAGAGLPGAQWAASDVGYMGFLFNPTNTLPVYGWAQFSVPADGQTMTLVNYAYENSGTAIITGAIPEPGTVAMGAIGAGFFFLVRRRQAS